MLASHDIAVIIKLFCGPFRLWVSGVFFISFVGNRMDSVVTPRLFPCSLRLKRLDLYWVRLKSSKVVMPCVVWRGKRKSGCACSHQRGSRPSYDESTVPWYISTVVSRSSSQTGLCGCVPASVIQSLSIFSGRVCLLSISRTAGPSKGWSEISATTVATTDFDQSKWYCSSSEIRLAISCDHATTLMSTRDGAYPVLSGHSLIVSGTIINSVAMKYASKIWATVFEGLMKWLKSSGSRFAQIWKIVTKRRYASKDEVLRAVKTPCRAL